MNKLILLLVILPSILFGQGWERTYGLGRGYSVQQTIDGGYIITGGLQNEGSPMDICVIKTDIYGDTSWINKFGGPFTDVGRSIQQTSDSGFIIAGSIEIGSGYLLFPDLSLIKTNKNGDTLWTKAYGKPYRDEYGLSVTQTFDGGYIVCGSKQGDDIHGSYVYLLKTDSEGDTLWTKTHGGQYSNIGWSVHQTIDSGYIITGKYSLDIVAMDSRIYLIKTDSQGDTLWTKKYGNISNNTGYSVQQTSDNGFIITGEFSVDVNDRKLFLIKTNENGSIIWQKTYGEEFNSVGYSVQQTTDNGYIVSGTKYTDDDPNEIYLIKTNIIGDTIWTRTFSKHWESRGFSIQQTNDGGFIITGDYYEVTDDHYIFLIKADENGIITSTIEIPVSQISRQLIKTVDISGKEIKNLKPNQPYIEIYDDGSVKKKMKIN